MLMSVNGLNSVQLNGAMCVGVCVVWGGWQGNKQSSRFNLVEGEEG